MFNDNENMQLLDCPFEVRERTPCDPFYRLISVEEVEDGTITMVLELVEGKASDDC